MHLSSGQEENAGIDGEIRTPLSLRPYQSGVEPLFEDLVSNQTGAESDLAPELIHEYTWQYMVHDVSRYCDKW